MCDNYLVRNYLNQQKVCNLFEEIIMKILATALCLTVAGISSAVSAGNYAVYSSSEYCELNRTKSTQLDQRYLKAYAKKLGSTPSKQLCQTIHKSKFASTETEIENFKWSYFQNKPYQGSIIRLSENTVDLLKAENIDAKKVLE